MEVTVATVEAWASEVRHWNPFVWWKAITDAGREVHTRRVRASAEDLEILIAFLQFPNKSIVGQAARGLSKIGGERACNALIEQLHQSEALNPNCIALALGKLRCPKAVEVLCTHARRGMPEAVRALGFIGDRSSTALFIALLKTNLNIKERDSLLREIFLALSKVPDVRALPALVEYWDRYWESYKTLHSICERMARRYYDEEINKIWEKVTGKYYSSLTENEDKLNRIKMTMRALELAIGEVGDRFTVHHILDQVDSSSIHYSSGAVNRIRGRHVRQKRELDSRTKTLPNK